MQLIKAANYEDLSKKAATIIAAQIIEKADSVLGFATGSTPEGTYRELANMCSNKLISFENIRSFNLDEYYGLPSDHPQSYKYYMNQNLFSKVNIKAENANVPNGSAPDPNEECKRYENAIKAAGGLDLQLLGIGRNGHIGFNEPGDRFEQWTHLVELTEDTLDANKRFFDKIEDVPKKAISMGINTIMNAEKVLLIANGKDKTDALEKMLYQPVTPNLPASVLQFHRCATVIYCD